MIHRRLSALLLTFCASAALGAGHDLAPAAYDASAFGAVNPQIAWNGSKYLALWQTNGEIFGAFISGDGTLLTPTPMAFPDIPGAAGGSMRIAAFGDDFLVVLPATPPHTAIIRSDATVSVDSPRLDIPQLGLIELAVNGTDIAIVDRFGRVANFFSRSGALKKSVTLSNTYGFSGGIAAWRDGFLAVTEGQDALTVWRFDRDGNQTAAIERIPYGLNTYPQPIAIASSGEEVLAAWAENDRTFSLHFRAARIADRAKVIDLPGSPTSAAWTGSAFLVATSAGFVRVSREGAIVDATPPSRDDVQAMAAHDGLAYALSPYCCAPVTGTSIVAAATLSASDPVLLGRARRAQTHPLIASNGVDFLALWSESSYVSSGLKAVRGDRDGAPASAPSSAAEGTAITPRGLAFSGSTYLALYASGPTAGAQRFSLAGVPLDPSPVPLHSLAFTAAAAPHGFLIGGFDQTGVQVALMGEDGTVGEPRLVPLAHDFRHIANVAVAFDGKQYLLLYAIGFTSILIDPPPPVWYEIDAIRLAADLTPIDTTPLVLDKSTLNMSVASNGDGFLVVLDRYEQRDTVAVRVNDALQVEAALPVLKWTSTPSSNVSWAGRDFVIATHHDDWLSINRVDSHNQLKPPGRAIAIDAPANDAPSIAATPTGDVVAVISEYPGRADTLRARSYLESELPLAPAVPPAPAITAFTMLPFSQISLSWSVAPSDIDSFVIETSSDFQTWSIASTVPGTERSTIVKNFNARGVRIRSLRGSRVSEPSAALDLRARRRAIR